jgi:hypothetical protein
MSNPNTAVYPSAIATNNVLPVADDTLFATLVGAINSSQTSGINFSIGSFNLPTLVVIDTEIILVETMSGSSVTACVRGFGGTTGASHVDGSSVFGYIVAYHNNQIVAEIVAIETALGVNLANVITTGETATGDLTGTYPGPTVATVGGASAGSVATAAGKAHTQNTDVGTSVNTVMFSATPSFDMNLGGIQLIVLTGNVTSSTLANLRIGQVMRFVIQQSSGGSNTFVWPTAVHGGMTISGTANIFNIQEFISWDGTTLYPVTAGLSQA